MSNGVLFLLEKEGNLTHATTNLDLKIPRVLKFIETESRKLPGSEERKMRSCYLMGIKEGWVFWVFVCFLRFVF
jgi:hypothetical protein